MNNAKRGSSRDGQKGINSVLDRHQDELFTSCLYKSVTINKWEVIFQNSSGIIQFAFRSN